MEELDELYKSADGETFTGKIVGYQPVFDMELTVIDIRDGGNFEQILEKIHHKGHGKVWKGFRGPLESHSFKHYRIWVDLQAPGRKTGKFIVTGYCGPFDFFNHKYSLRKGYRFEVNYE